jgi:hypothetical protein
MWKSTPVIPLAVVVDDGGYADQKLARSAMAYTRPGAKKKSAYAKQEMKLATFGTVGTHRDLLSIGI